MESDQLCVGNIEICDDQKAEIGMFVSIFVNVEDYSSTVVRLNDGFMLTQWQSKR
jgi:hypothetical protein